MTVSEVKKSLFAKKSTREYTTFGCFFLLFQNSPTFFLAKLQTLRYFVTN